MKQWISFVVGGTEYVADSAPVQRVVRNVKVTPLPEAPGQVLGVINLQGKVVPVIDTDSLFGANSGGETLDAAQMIIIDAGGEQAALPVDEVTDVEIDRGDSLQPSPVDSDLVTGFVIRNGEAVPVIDLQVVVERGKGGGSR